MNSSAHSEPKIDTLEGYRAAEAGIAVPTLRLLHISDLHFVDHPLFRHIRIDGVRGHNVDARDALVTIAKELQPDLIFATGDQTTWGDRRSLKSASAFLARLTASVGLTKSRLFCIPGNHDVLLHYYRPFSGGGKRNYERFFRAPQAIELAQIKGYEIAIFPFDSTLKRELKSLFWPLKSSMGQVSPSAFNAFNKARQACEDLNKKLKIACVHHHPLPIPHKRTNNQGVELTTMTNGGTFIAYMQECGVNLVLHGHEHVPYSCAYRYSTDAPDLVIAAAGSACQSHCENPGFNFIQVIPNNRTIVKEYVYSEVGFRTHKDGTKVWPHRNLTS